MTLKYNASLKYSPAHDSPWLTVESDNEEELHAALASLGEPESGSPFWTALGRAVGAFKRDALLGEVLGAQAIPAQAGPSWSAPPAQPAAGFTAPAAAPAAQGDARYCQHGMRNFKSGINKNNKPYSGYFCTANSCPPEWG